MQLRFDNIAVCRLGAIWPNVWLTKQQPSGLLENVLSNEEQVGSRVEELVQLLVTFLLGTAVA